jgi:3-hydroxyisobutyrate dehydrogenase-like beta-hydroxyacid dehydrogenase
MNSETKKKMLAVIGLGNMGGALATTLLARDYTVNVWNRTASRAAPLVEQGAALVEGVEEAAKLSDTLIICVAEYSVIKTLLYNDAVEEALRGKSLIQLGVLTVAEAQENAAWAEDHGIGYLEGSILGVPDNVVAGKAQIVCSGPREQFDRYNVLLQSFGPPIHISATIGAAYEVDKLLYPLSWGIAMGLAQGAAMTHAAGYSIDAFNEILNEWIKAVPGRVEKFSELIAVEDFTAYQATLTAWLASYEKSHSLCKSLDVDDTLMKAHIAMMQKAVERGYGDEEIMAVYKSLLPKQ